MCDDGDGTVGDFIPDFIQWVKDQHVAIYIGDCISRRFGFKYKEREHWRACEKILYRGAVLLRLSQLRFKPLELLQGDQPYFGQRKLRECCVTFRGETEHPKLKLRTVLPQRAMQGQSAGEIVVVEIRAKNSHRPMSVSRQPGD